MNNDSDMTLFEPEVVLPAQMTGGARIDGDTSGARALMLAILEDAMLCIERGRGRRHPRTRQLAAEAETWVRSDCREWLFSFASICDVLGFDPDALRARLLPHVEHPASGGRAARAETDARSIRTGAVVRMLPQREDARGSIAADATAPTPAWRSDSRRVSAAGFGVRALVGVA